MKFAASVFFAIAIWISPGLLSACSCVPLSSTCKFNTGSEAVFVGTVMSKESPGPRLRDGKLSFSSSVSVRFSVAESFRGVEGDEIEVSTAQYGPMCGYPFEIGQSYLVFAVQGQDGSLSTGRCSGTRPAIGAAALIEQLKAIKSGRSPANVFGLISRSSRDNSIPAPQNENVVAGATIKVSGKSGVVFSTQSRANGTYEFRDLPADEYQIQTALPHGLKIRDPLLPAKLLELTSSCERNILAVPEGAISGRVQTADGQPLQAFVMAAPSDPEERRNAFQKGGLVGFETGPDGVFSLSPIWPGRYRLRMSPKVDGRNWCYHPNLIDVAEAQHIEGLILTLCSTAKSK
ncbi:MAG: hypothetical protein JWO20_2266 [Candidatus Angelobacter sp.]|jgi:hypothetical protein|nr:hypothetical protein [Candidatus Angelobacter sp.]